MIVDLSRLLTVLPTPCSSPSSRGFGDPLLFLMLLLLLVFMLFSLQVYKYSSSLSDIAFWFVLIHFVSIAPLFLPVHSYCFCCCSCFCHVPVAAPITSLSSPLSQADLLYISSRFFKYGDKVAGSKTKKFVWPFSLFRAESYKRSFSVILRPPTLYQGDCPRFHVRSKRKSGKSFSWEAE